jgi:hypothetical protein
MASSFTNVISQRVLEVGYVAWCNIAEKWDSATTIALNCKFENYFLLPKTTDKFVTYALLVRAWIAQSV